MRIAGSSAAVATGSSESGAPAIALPYSVTPSASARSTEITRASAGNPLATASTRSRLSPSVTTIFAPASRSRYSSASGPNKVERGSATAPSL